MPRVELRVGLLASQQAAASQPSVPFLKLSFAGPRQTYALCFQQ